MNFPGAEDYEPGCDPARDLSPREQVEYWKARARLAEERAYSPTDESAVADGNLQRVADLEDGDDADWWKREQ